MAKRNELYKCEVCGNIVQLLHVGGGELVCCGKPMKLVTENTVDASKEKHVPVISKVDGGYKVQIGAVPHPMEEKHYIQWIELEVDGRIQRKFLAPGDKPEAIFCCCEGCCSGKTVIAREYCNLHGYWKSEGK